MVPLTADSRSSRVVALVCSLAVALALLPGAAVALPSAPSISPTSAQQVGGDVVVGPNQTVTDDVSAATGDVIVRGTVEGDVTAAAGSVRITGEVTDDVSAAAGSITVDGHVGGTVEAAAGSITVGPDATIDGDVEAAAGSVSIAGAVDGDVAGTETVRLEDGAVVGGDVRYGESLDRAAGATVDGSVVHESTHGWEFGVVGLDGGFEDAVWFVPSALVSVVTGLTGLVVGALLLVLFPEFTAALVGTVTDEPVRAAAAGVATLVAVPAVLIAVAMTIVGIPLALAGGAVFTLAVWIGLIYGEFLVGTRVLAAADVESRWAALALGVLGVETLSLIPVAGGLLRLAVVLLGLGTGTLVLAARWQGEGGDGAAETPPPDHTPPTA